MAFPGWSPHRCLRVLLGARKWTRNRKRTRASISQEIQSDLPQIKPQLICLWARVLSKPGVKVLIKPEATAPDSPELRFALAFLSIPQMNIDTRSRIPTILDMSAFRRGKETSINQAPLEANNHHIFINMLRHRKNPLRPATQKLSGTNISDVENQWQSRVLVLTLIIQLR